MRFPTLLLAALLAAPAFAQSGVTLRPGHPDLMTDGLTFESHVEAVRVAQPAVQDLGVVTHSVTRDGDTVTLNVDANVPQAGNVGESSLTFDAVTLAPMSQQKTTRGSSGSATYDGARVTGAWSRGEWDPLAFDITLPSAPFAAEQVGIVARALPFRAGYTATVPTFDPARRVRDVAVSVVGQEDFTRADGSTVAVWAVEAVTAGRGGGTQRYLVSADTRELVATTVEPQAGTVVVTEPTTEEALAALAEQNAAAIALRPGGDGYDASLLTDGTWEYDLKLVEPQQQDIGSLSRAVAIDRDAGTITLTTSQNITVAGQEVSQVAVAEYPSLRPISATTTVNGEVYETAYGDGVASRTGGDEPSEIAFDEPVFDSNFLFEVVRLLPYQAGYRASFYTLSASEGEQAVTVSVGEPMEVEGQTAWPVRTEGGPGLSFTFYVAPETREIVRIDQAPQVGVVIHVVPSEMEMDDM